MLHEGHRKRIYEKFASGELLQEHERLEILLFNAYPRKNTNPIAHKLLNAFGSMRGVFEADIKKLTEIDGVGESVALYLKCIWACTKSAYLFGGSEKFLKNYGDFKEFAVNRLRSKTEEVLELYMLEKNGAVKYIFSHSCGDRRKVSAERDEISSVIASTKPFGLLIAHNHLTGDSRPSAQDDKFTAEISMLCNLSGVTLYDHCIYASDNNVYSYFTEGRLDEIKSKFNVNTLMNNRR